MTSCLMNGELADSIGIDDRGLLYGDGIFETIRISAGKPRFWQGHMERLAMGCERLFLPKPPQALLLREVRTMVAGMPEGVAKIILTRGVAPRGYAPPEFPEATRIVAAYPLAAEGQMDTTRGVRTRISKLRLALQPALAGIKHLNRLEQVIASSEEQDPAVAESILLDPEDFVISAISANLFVVDGDRILTPRLDRCGVKGVLRAEIIRAFKSRCELRQVSLDMLAEADEVFIGNAVQGVIPVRSVDHWQYEIGSTTRDVQSWLDGL